MAGTVVCIAPRQDVANAGTFDGRIQDTRPPLRVGKALQARFRQAEKFAVRFGDRLQGAQHLLHLFSETGTCGIKPLILSHIFVDIRAQDIHAVIARITRQVVNG